MDATGSPNPNHTDARGARLTREQETQLLEAHRRGDAAALAELLRSYQRRVYQVCHRMTGGGEEAADLTQDTLVRIMEGLDGFDGRAALSTWVIRVTMNTCLSHLRKQRLRRHPSLDDAVGPAGSPRSAGIEERRELSAPRRIEQAEVRNALLRSMAELDPAMRAVLVLRDLQGLEYQEIAVVLEVPVGTVKSRLFRARAALRTAVEERLGGGADPRGEGSAGPASAASLPRAAE